MSYWDNLGDFFKIGEQLGKLIGKIYLESKGLGGGDDEDDDDDGSPSKDDLAEASFLQVVKDNPDAFPPDFEEFDEEA